MLIHNVAREIMFFTWVLALAYVEPSLNTTVVSPYHRIKNEWLQTALTWVHRGFLTVRLLLELALYVFY